MDLDKAMLLKDKVLELEEVNSIIKVLEQKFDIVWNIFIPYKGQRGVQLPNRLKKMIFDDFMNQRKEIEEFIKKEK